ncbi:MAG: HAMP domain-containing protein [Chloroflexi bacterium]|nr:HAMP domain-containing protein [Chloroflexota bacterium]
MSRYFSSIRTKLVLAFLPVVLLPLIGTGLYGNWTTSRTLEMQAIDAARADLMLRAREIESYLGGAREDLIFLSQLKSLGALTASDRPASILLTNVQADFAAFAATHPGVFQVRYLDAAGMEIARIDSRPASRVQIVTNTQLQNKADRYYFTETMKLSVGEVYISPADLNREFGLIESPYIPTIRYATPLFRADGARAGIVIFNLYAQPFLKFARDSDRSGAVIALVDEAGYYLAHPDSTREWGGPDDLNTNKTAASDYPQTWNVIVQHPAGVVSPPPENLIAAILDEVLPIDWTNNPQTRRVLIYETVLPDGAKGPRWRLLRDEPSAYLFSSIGTFRLTAITILALAAFSALIIAITFSRSLTAPILALTEDVRRLGRIVTVSTASNSIDSTHRRDEISELTAAFNEMSSALNQHLDQLALLNRAGHNIAARLERPAVLATAARAVTMLLPAEYCVLRFTADNGVTILHTTGEARWETERSDPNLRALFEAAIADGEWRVTSVANGYLCVTPLCVSGRSGLIEVYGTNIALTDPTSGNLLSALGTQISIALENAELYERLAEHRAELQALVERLINAQEEERRVIAYDIHDGLIQMLVGARLQISNASRATDQSGDPFMRKGLDELATAIAEARRVIEGLRPATLDDLGLVTTLRQYATENSVLCGCDLEFSATPPDMRLPPLIEITAFRIAQEAINNIRKYAQSKRLRLSLNLNADQLVLEVRDSGRGFDPESVAEGRGLGLVGMRERARLVGGECVIESEIGVGTTVRASLPIHLSETK